MAKPKPLVTDFNSSDPRTKMDRAIVQVIISHPFFASVLLRLKRIEGYIEHTPLGDIACLGPCQCPVGVVWPQCPHSMATDGRHLWWNPRFVAVLTGGETQGVLCHEVGHVVGLHPIRRNNRKPRPWNYACDQAINHILAMARLPLPAHVVPGVPDKCAEELYLELPETAGGTGKNSMSGVMVPGGYGRNGGEEGRMIGDVIDPKNPDGSELSPKQRADFEAQTRIIVQQAINAAKAAGTMPAGMERLLHELMEPKIPWKEILSRFIDSNHRFDYSWLRPNRRYVGDGLMFPSLWSPGYGRVLLGCDTSGSISQELLRDICSELIGCLDTYAERGQPTELDVLWFDATVYHQVVSAPEDLKPQGGGGTHFEPVFDWVREQSVDIRAVIMVTDGYPNSPNYTPPDCPVLWVLTQPNSSFNPPFGEIASIINT